MVSRALVAVLLAFPVALLGQAQAPDSQPPPIYDDLGSLHHPITTSSEKTQAYFDQGLRLMYAFNHAEAIRAFREGARIDPSCAMCWWGIALAYGPNINAPMDSASGVAAYEAAQKALELAPQADERERAYIEAVAKRYAPGAPTAERAALDSAYARAMGKVADRWPDDLDAATLEAEARMDLSPWNYWAHAGTGYEPRPDTPRILQQLESVIARNPDHPGACHYYIHAVEAASPEKAVPCAERLAQLMPGAGHLVHMPGHIYIRVGRYADAIRANEHALHSDETYIVDQRPAMGVYVGAYYPHNFHFLAFASTLAGRSAEALSAARSAAEKMPDDIALIAPDFQQIEAYPQLVGVTFGRWDEVLADPMPRADLPIATALAHYARGVAYAAKGESVQALKELADLRGLVGDLPEGPIQTTAEVAVHSLQGEIAARTGRYDEATDALRQAADLEDSLPYLEPPHWPRPVRQVLGVVLLEAGKPAEAEVVYREDLARFPRNGWSLLGLEQSLKAQGKTDEAAEVDEEFQVAWAGADVKLPASSF
jgi:tetratricopeptide (TPR) repeat protein